MRKYAWFALPLSIALLAACSKTVLVTVPPRMDLSGYETLGIVEFNSNARSAINAAATRKFQEQVQFAQPGTRFVDLGSRDALLNAVGSAQLDVDALKKIGAKYGVAAVFIGDIVYSEPKTDVKITDIKQLEGAMRTEIRGDISSKLVETRTGASVWSSSAWAKRQIGRLNVSAEKGISGTMSDSDVREEMLADMVYYLTQDFRSRSVRRKVN